MRPGAPPGHGPIDWAELRRRLEAAGLALSGETVASPEADASLLEARARLLARSEAAARPAEALEILTFSLGSEVYGIESRVVLEVFRPAAVAVLPGAQPPLFGVTAWRGDLLRLLDLRPAFGIPADAPDAAQPVVVIGVSRAPLGLLVDVVHELIRLEAADVRPPSPDRAGPGRDYLRGITSSAVLVLEAGGLLGPAGGDPP